MTVYMIVMCMVQFAIMDIIQMVPMLYAHMIVTCAAMCVRRMIDFRNQPL